MTLHEKIVELTKIGLHVKFEPFMDSNKFRENGITVELCYNGVNAVKVINTKIITPEDFKEDGFVVSVLTDLYYEMTLLKVVVKPYVK